MPLKHAPANGAAGTVCLPFARPAHAQAAAVATRRIRGWGMGLGLANSRWRCPLRRPPLLCLACVVSGGPRASLGIANRTTQGQGVDVLWAPVGGTPWAVGSRCCCFQRLFCGIPLPEPPTYANRGVCTLGAPRCRGILAVHVPQSHDPTRSARRTDHCEGDGWVSQIPHSPDPPPSPIPVCQPSN